ncbi:helix-turn-helix domain-containing protein [Nocardia sputi]|uniref:helix-turn-helix domain-containing protein n=1 Tax=Nocardia sputi TaxID=2943705 RepID=UPI0018948FDB|nr:helix-turn-helix transcriptional regulator [Nocardia sputi]MBF6207310.1 helix-turn-helix domain-containing protein [Streptomyces gardneri]
MPRSERPLDPSSGPIHAFAADLRRLRARAGNPKYLQMARLSGRSRTALSEAAGGDHLPTWETTEAFVKACGGDVGTWLTKWEQVQEQVSVLSARTTTARSGPRDESAHGADNLPTRTVDTRSDNSEGPVDVVLRLWQEQRTQARQSENHRAIMTLVVVVGAVGGMVYVAVQPDSRILSATVALSVCLLGLFGALISAKYYERFKMHMDGAEHFHRRLDELYPQLRIEQLWSDNESQHSRNYKVLYGLRLHHLWVAAHLGIVLLGGTVAIVQLTG